MCFWQSSESMFEAIIIMILIVHSLLFMKLFDFIKE